MQLRAQQLKDQAIPRGQGGLLLAVKRGIDIVLAAALLPFLLPIMAVLAVMIRLDSQGPILFKDKRLGIGGHTFTCLKFRTMHVASEATLQEYLARNPEAREEWDRFRKLRGFDPRVTRRGQAMRKLSLDELPQIFNVLKGDMSLVGPRPYLTSEWHLMGAARETILKVRPGITGLWQVMGRNEITFADRLRMESWYVQNWSLWLDMTTLVRTIGVVVTRRGAS